MSYCFSIVAFFPVYDEKRGMFQENKTCIIVDTLDEVFSTIAAFEVPPRRVVIHLLTN